MMPRVGMQAKRCFAPLGRPGNSWDIPAGPIMRHALGMPGGSIRLRRYIEWADTQVRL